MSNSAEKHIQENILNELFSNKLEELGDFKRSQSMSKTRVFWKESVN